MRRLISLARMKRCNYCGNSFKVTTLFLIQLLFMKKVYRTCPFCHKVSCYRLIYHIVHDTLDMREKEVNQLLRGEFR